MATIDIQMTGVDEMIRKLERISSPQKLKKVQRKALTAGARIMRKAYKEEAPKGETGNLKRSAMFKVRVDAFAGTAVAKVGSDARIAPHAHLVEFGTVTRFLKKGGTTGKMPPNRFATRAFVKSEDAAAEAWMKTAEEEIGKSLP